MNKYKFRVEVTRLEMQIMQTHLKRESALYVMIKSATRDGADFFCVWADFIYKTFGVDLSRNEAKSLFYISAHFMMRDKVEEILGNSQYNYMKWFRDQFISVKAYMDAIENIKKLRQLMWTNPALTLRHGAISELSLSVYEFSFIYRTRDDAPMKLIKKMRDKINNLMESILEDCDLQYIHYDVFVEHI